MAIQSGDIKLLKSQVMLDAPEGGGAPTGNVIADGTSNGIFPDISELDRAGGRVNLRKVFASVDTLDTDGYFGSNVIVADPPDDPNVSVTLFSTNDVFDRRTDAQSRMEAYLAQGPIYSGYLFGNHIAGMRVITILQREEVPLPVVGDTFVLRAFEGTAGEIEQFVRVSDISTQLRTFTDDRGDFKRMQVNLDITDALRDDYPGFDALRFDSAINYTGKTKFYSTIVADAARYYGVVPLEIAADTGDLTVKGENIFTQLVPSTRIEVPIADARMNQQLATLVSTGSSIERTISAIFTTTQAMYVGGAILPGSLTLTRGGVTLTDRGGILYDAANTQAGTIDYDNGVLTLTVNVFGTSSGSHTVTYTPAVTPTIVSESIGLEVTQQGQRLSWVVTLDPVPAKRTLQVSYRALGRWYVLTEDGNGTIRGSDSSFGAGTLNYSTGTVSLTLGALPDVESRIVLTWAPTIYSRTGSSVPQQGPSLPRAFGKTLELGSAIEPGTLSITWNDGTAKTATDSNGQLVGDATGTVEYGKGRVRFRPNTLPAKNTNINVSLTENVQSTGSVVAFLDGGAAWTFDIGATNVKPRSVNLAVVASYPERVFPGVDQTVGVGMLVFDDGSGNLQVANISGNLTVGSINYSTGACSINKTVSGFNSNQKVWTNTTPLGASGDPSSYIKLTGYQTRSLTLTFLNGPMTYTISNPAWSWWTGNLDVAARTRYSAASGSADSTSFLFDAIFMPYEFESYLHQAGFYSFVPQGSFTLGTKFHQSQFVTGTYRVVTDISPATGEGTVVGQIGYEAGLGSGFSLTDWVAGVSSAPVNTNVATAPPTAEMLIDSVMIRSAVSPLLNSGFSVAGTTITGATFTASPDGNGVFSTGSAPANDNAYGSFGVFGVVDYEMGIADLRFGRRVGANLVGSTSGLIDVSELGIPGVTQIQAQGVQSDTLRYNAVGYSYLPLDSNILGLDPVRLPSDGRVPIFRPGSFAVMGHTGTIGPQTVSNGQTINCGRVRLSRVRVIGNNGQVINVGYTTDLDAGTVTFTDVTGYSQPVTIEHRIEDMMLVSDAQINGQLSFTRPITHDYPVPGSYVSSALIAGDLRARVSVIFDQGTWNNTWSDAPSGSAATGTYNDILNPIEVSNRGALTERWAIQFVNSTSFNVIGENVGVIAIGNTGSDCAPLNPATNTPYFTIRAAGWGLGWATGNVLRFNTIGAFYPVWVARTILQGPETVPNDSFTLLIRGDVDRP